MIILLIFMSRHYYKLNINKYLHEFKEDYDILLWSFLNIDIFNKVIKNNYEQVVFLEKFDYKLLKPLNFNLKNNFNNENKIYITYIIACYNSENFIEDTLDSLQNQTNKNFEVIIINDFSTDNIDNKIKVIINNYSFKINYLKNKENYGNAKTKSIGIGNCNTEYFSIINSTDVIDKDTNKIILENISKFPEVGFFYSNFYYCDNNLKIIKEGYCREISEGKTNLEENVISHLGIFKKKDYYMTLGYIENNYFRHCADDKDIYFKLEEKCKIKFIDEFLYFYRGSLTKKKGSDECEKLFELAKERALIRRKNNLIIENYLNKK